VSTHQDFYAPTPLDKVLHLICAKMQLTQTQWETAEGHYKAVTGYLSREGGPFALYGLDIYPQGSVRIGTTVKPQDQEEYDLDLVCHMENCAPEWSRNPPVLLHALVQDLKSNGRYAHMVKPMNRCVRLDYAGDFHMDILPACQDTPRCDTCIVVPDQELHNWSPSNPIGFADWFEKYASRHPAILEVRALMEKAAEVEPFPENDPYTIVPLKRVVQLLKRNRDIHFKGRKVPSTPSVIITTLAAQQYGGAASVADAIMNILSGILRDVEIAERENAERRLVVLNPMNENEDFSEKWENRARYDAFKTWVQDLLSKMALVIQAAGEHGLDAVQPELERLFGERYVTAAYGSLRESVPGLFERESLIKAAMGVGIAKTRQAAARLMPFSEHRERPENQGWVMAYNPMVRVEIELKGRPKRQTRGFMIGKTYRFPNDRSPLPKKFSLHFEAKVFGIQPPYRVHWRVCNTGKEAEAHNCLRGDFYPGEGKYGRFRNESTDYKGSHWVDAFVVKDGRCLARSEIFIVNIA